VARRIALPSSAELFGDRGPYARSAADEATPAVARPRAKRPSRAKPAPRRPRLTARIDRVEQRLRDLPIDTLLELRDGLEALLLGGTISEGDVERVLAAAEG
jgi:hypothetical protein